MIVQLGMGTGKPFVITTFTPEMRQAIADGITNFWQQDFSGIRHDNAKELISGNIFDTHELLQNN